MKKLALAFIVVAATGFSGFASASINESTEQNLVKVCKALKSDSSIKLNKAVKHSRISYESLAEGLVCDGQSAVSFAIANGAEKTAHVFAKRANLNTDIAQVNY
jgi:hypothetical protein